MEKKKQSPVSGNFFNKNFASSIWFLLFRPDATIWNLFRVLFFAWWHHVNYFPHWNFWWRINFIAVFLQWELIRQIWIQKEIFDFFSSNVFWKKQQIPSKIKFIICTGNLFALSFSFMLRKRLCFFLNFSNILLFCFFSSCCFNKVNWCLSQQQIWMCKCSWFSILKREPGALNPPSIQRTQVINNQQCWKNCPNNDIKEKKNTTTKMKKIHVIKSPQTAREIRFFYINNYQNKFFFFRYQKCKSKIAWCELKTAWEIGCALLIVCLKNPLWLFWDFLSWFYLCSGIFVGFCLCIFACNSVVFLWRHAFDFSFSKTLRIWCGTQRAFFFHQILGCRQSQINPKIAVPKNSCTGQGQGRCRCCVLYFFPMLSDFAKITQVFALVANLNTFCRQKCLQTMTKIEQTKIKIQLLIKWICVYIDGFVFPC